MSLFGSKARVALLVERAELAHQCSQVVAVVDLDQIVVMRLVGFAVVEELCALGSDQARARRRRRRLGLLLGRADNADVPLVVVVRHGCVGLARHDLDRLFGLTLLFEIRMDRY